MPGLLQEKQLKKLNQQIRQIKRGAFVEKSFE
jgi:hypothetical protein